jgi:hypothetical protein
MRTGPVIPTGEDPAMPQQERQQLLALAPNILGGGRTSANLVAHRLVHLVRHPDAAEFAGTKQPG